LKVNLMFVAIGLRCLLGADQFGDQYLRWFDYQGNTAGLLLDNSLWLYAKPLRSTV